MDAETTNTTKTSINATKPVIDCIKRNTRSNHYNSSLNHHKINRNLLLKTKRRGYNYLIKSRHKLTNSRYLKLPILASVELVSNDECHTRKSSNRSANQNSGQTTVLFKNYVLIPSRTKFKHLVYTVFDQINLQNKSSYNVIDGYLQIQNWKPIKLDSISSITQCKLTSFTNAVATSKPDHHQSTSNKDNERSRSFTHSDTDKKSFSNIENSLNENHGKHESTASNGDCHLANSEMVEINRRDSLDSDNNEEDEEDDEENYDNSRNNDKSCSSSVSDDLSISNSISRRSSLSNDETQRLNDKSHNEFNAKTPKTNCSKMNSDESDYVTVNDMLSHVISFATLNIKLTLNKQSENVQTEPIQKTDAPVNHAKFQPSQTFTEEDEEDEEAEKPSHQPLTYQQQAPQAQTAPTQSQQILQTYLMQTIQQQMQNNISTTTNENPIKSDDLTKLLLPILMLNNQQQQQQQQSSQTVNSSQSQNQLAASLLPMLNLPLFSQLFKTQPKPQKSTEPLNLSSSSSSSTNSNLPGKNRQDELFSHNNDHNNNNNNHPHPQPLNLCKVENPASKRKPYPSPNSLLSVNVNANNACSISPLTSSSSSQVNSNIHNNNNNNNNNTSLFNASPSPSISSSASSTSSTSSSISSSSISKNKIANNHPTQITNNFTALNPFPQQQQKLKQEFQNQNSAQFNGKTNGNNGGQVKSRRQRERTTFDPQEEITRLMQIFEQTHHPTRYQIASICESLNSLACRKDKKPLEPYNIQYWFKNARAALRRKVKVGGGCAGGPNGNSNFPTTSGSDLIKKEDLDKESEFDENCHNGKVVNGVVDYELNDSNYDDDENDDEFYDDEPYDTENDLNPNTNLDSSKNKLINEFKYDTTSHDLHNNNNNNLDMDNQSESEFDNYNDENTNDDENNYAQLTNDENNNNNYDDDETTSKKNNLMNSFNGANSNNSIAGGKAGGKQQHSLSGNRRNRVFIDPISEVPILEHYFSIETYPDHYLIEKICENLNKGEYRYKFPKLESRNIQLWFKNHRAKLKRLKSGGGVGNAGGNSSNNTANNTSSPTPNSNNDKTSD